ncbi:host-nuclease inhibitor protein Gam [Pluralibacter gergoviae]|uniref:host-nuclease inhibitor Gam family protein n=1 Tax=Pluralibacter gergoviae TaxID=61647 RepID=UPI00190AC5EE|nr:host-nuclease inhibitor Gam family protein [Pluralibacter gergoviae]MBK4119376.1 host-nuclease inhibitor protein Gam [Pluralibacter gergoviae]
MNAYRAYDAIEQKSWDTHYQQVASEEREVELADDFEKGLPFHKFESLFIAELLRCGASKQAIIAAFGTADFEDKLAFYRRSMVEAVARQQVKIESEENQ